METDYAVRIVSALASSGSALSAAVLAKQTGVSQNFCLKILRRLSKAGVAASIRGVSGGYRLNKKPSDITLREIIEIIEGPIIIARCQCADYTCDHPGDQSCYFQSIFENTSREIAEKFGKITFEQK